MDIGTLLIVAALCGEVRSTASEDETAAQAADLDGQIEVADEKPEIESDSPAAADGGESPPAPTDKAGEPADGTMTPTRNVATSPPTADALVEWLAEGDTSLDGKRIALVDLLSRVYDRRQQALVIPAYWKLSAAEYEYCIATDESLRLGQLLPPADAAGKHATDPLLESRLAAAEARVREAELAVLAQQYALADQMHLPANEPLPLTADLPHAGAYRTFFQERYARTAPPRGHLIDRMLPLLHRSIELRAAAAQSAADSAEAATDAFHAGQLDLTSVVDCIAELTRQRRAFVSALRDYNLDIAEYALAVVPAGLTGGQLVGVLIGPPRTAQRNVPDERKPATSAGDVNQAGFTAPASSPTLAPRQNKVRQASPGADGIPRSISPGTGGDNPSVPAARPGGRKSRVKSISPGSTSRRQTTTQLGSFSPYQPEAQARTNNEPTSLALRVSARPPRKRDPRLVNDPVPRYRASKPPLGGAAPQQPEENGPLEAAASGPSDQGLYSALRDLSPLDRAQELSATLHWQHQTPDAQAAATTLLQALTASAGFDRRTVIQAYWRGCEQVAASQVMTQEVEQLQSLESAALKLHSQPGGAEAMLRLRTARLAAQASAEESQAGVLDAQFALAQLMRKPLSGAWPWPTTPPHAGGYRLKLDAQSSTVLQSSAVRQVARSLPLRQEALQRHADAVVAADAERVAAMLGLQTGQRGLPESVAAVRLLSSETLEFLDTQTQYNTQFSDYVLSVAPAGLSDSALAGVLVVSR